MLRELPNRALVGQEVRPFGELAPGFMDLARVLLSLCTSSEVPCSAFGAGTTKEHRHNGD